jgi:hypothetical protein
MVRMSNHPPGSLRAFIERVASNEGPVPWHVGRLAEVLERAATERIFALVCMPPRSAKTVTIRRALAWMLHRSPERTNLYVGFSEANALRVSRSVRSHHHAVPAHGATEGSPARWTTPQGGGLVARGASSSSAGFGVDGVAIVDDLSRRRAHGSIERMHERDRCVATLRDVFTRIEEPVGSVVLVTSWQPAREAFRYAAVEHLAQRPPSERRFEVVNLPALRDPTTDAPSDADDAIPLWPERYPLEDLRKYRDAIGPAAWQSVYQGVDVQLTAAEREAEIRALTTNAQASAS